MGPEDKGIVKTGLDALNNLVSNTVKSSADNLCTSGQSTGGLIRDSCERISVLQYCDTVLTVATSDTTYGWDRRCRFKGWAMAIFIGVPVLAVIIIAGLVLYCTRKKSTT